jgi:hypothetical protein
VWLRLALTDKTLNSAVVFNDGTRWVAAQNRRVPAKSQSHVIGAPSFSPYQSWALGRRIAHSPFRPFALSPFRPFALSPHCSPGLFIPKFLDLTLKSVN